jgi:hypothetical protein
MKRVYALLILFATTAFAGASEEAPSTAPNRVPLTRPEMKVALEELKDREPRIPMPEINEEERKLLGERADHYEARLRLKYLSHEPPRTGSREPDPAMTLTYEFKTQMFWIVARMNNCHY